MKLPRLFGHRAKPVAVTFEAKRPYCYDELFSYIRVNWDAHDKGCESLEWLWLGHPGGVSCPSDLTDCENCGVTFYNEGVANVLWREPGTERLYLCSCCARSRGYDVHDRLSQDMTGALVDIEEFPAPTPSGGTAPETKED